MARDYLLVLREGQDNAICVVIDPVDDKELDNPAWDRFTHQYNYAPYVPFIREKVLRSTFPPDDGDATRTKIYLMNGANNLPNPRNWNPLDNKVEVLASGGSGYWGSATATGNGGGGGAFAWAENLDNVRFPVVVNTMPAGATASFGTLVTAQGGTTGNITSGGVGGSTVFPQGYPGGNGGVGVNGNATNGGGGGGGAGGPGGAGGDGGATATMPAGDPWYGAGQGGTANGGDHPPRPEGAGLAGVFGNAFGLGFGPGTGGNGGRPGSVGGGSRQVFGAGAGGSVGDTIPAYAMAPGGSPLIKVSYTPGRANQTTRDYYGEVRRTDTNAVLARVFAEEDSFLDDPAWLTTFEEFAPATAKHMVLLALNATWTMPNETRTRIQPTNACRAMNEPPMWNPDNNRIEVISRAGMGGQGQNTWSGGGGGGSAFAWDQDADIAWPVETIDIPAASGTVAAGGFVCRFGHVFAQGGADASWNNAGAGGTSFGPQGYRGGDGGWGHHDPGNAPNWNGGAGGGGSAGRRGPGSNGYNGGTGPALMLWYGGGYGGNSDGGNIAFDTSSTNWTNNGRQEYAWDAYNAISTGAGGRGASGTGGGQGQTTVGMGGGSSGAAMGTTSSPGGAMWYGGLVALFYRAIRPRQVYYGQGVYVA